MVIINQPIYISSGVNSDIRYNFEYPRWAYDRYRELMQSQGWQYADYWDAMSPEIFTDSSFHLDAAGTCAFAETIAEEILHYAES
jgi:hypothetical protein